MITFSWGLAPPSGPVVFGSSPSPVTSRGTGDLAVFWRDGAADLGLLGNDLAQDGSLASAVLLSLILHRFAEPGSELAPEVTDRQGWWARDVDGFDIGSRLWTLERSKIDGQTLALAEEYGREALAWTVSDGVAESVRVVAEHLDRGNGYLLSGEIVRPGRDTARFQFRSAWTAQENG